MSTYPKQMNSYYWTNVESGFRYCIAIHSGFYFAQERGVKDGSREPPTVSADALLSR
jgi:hypothetical protein